MKRRIERPSEGGMRFFTPELYLRFNSSDPTIADRADAEWEMALRSYRAYLVTIENRMTSQVKLLAESCYHDAELLAFNQSIDSRSSVKSEKSQSRPLRRTVAVLSVMQSDGIITNIIYTLADLVRELPRWPDWPFAKERKHWLYDEIEMTSARGGAFVHRILFSDGNVIEVPFLSVVLNSFSMEQHSAVKCAS